jgi:Ran GTPase-activating protein (RanGAP) involved in mRNA processing and transport
MNPGVIDVLHSCKINTKLEKLILADTHCDEVVLEKFGELIAANSTLSHISFGHNPMGEFAGPLVKDALLALNEEGIRVNTTL